MNTLLMKGLIAKNGDTQTALADALGMPVSCLNRRILGAVEFKSSEIVAIKERYALSAEEVNEIFFAQ